MNPEVILIRSEVRILGLMASWSAVGETAKLATLGGALVCVAILLGVSISLGLKSRKSTKSNVVVKESVQVDTNKSKKGVNVYDTGFKDRQWSKDDAFNKYIKACAETERIQKEIDRIKLEYNEATVKEQELGALSTSYYSQWASIGDGTFEDPLYINFQKTDIEYKNSKNITKEIFSRLSKLKREYEDAERLRREAFVAYNRILELFETYNSNVTNV